MRKTMRVILITLSALAALAPAHLLAVTPAVLIGPDLKPREVMLQTFAGGKITYFDADRTLQIESTTKLLQIRMVHEDAQSDDTLNPGTTPKPETSSVPGTRTINQAATPVEEPQAAQVVALARLDLIDGQRIIARWTGASDDGQKLTFEHDTLGKLTVSLEVVSRFMLDGSAAGGATPASDRVLLSNGDALEGFVSAIGQTTVDVQIGSNKPIALPIERVRGLVLANPQRLPDKPRDVVMLRDGSRLAAGTVSIEQDRLNMMVSLAGDKPVAVDTKAVARVELASPKGRLVDLAELPMKVIDGGDVFGLALPPRVEGDAIRLHAPMTAEFELPANAKRFAATAELHASGPGAEWANFILSLRAAGTQVARQAISHKEPGAAINVELNGRSLTLILDPSTDGPIMDRLRLREAVVYVERE